MAYATSKIGRSRWIACLSDHASSSPPESAASQPAKAKPSATRRIPERQGGVRTRPVADIVPSRVTRIARARCPLGRAGVQHLREIEIEANDGRLRQHALRDGGEDEEQHEAHTEAEREIEAEVVGGGESTEENRLRAGRSVARASVPGRDIKIRCHVVPSARHAASTSSMSQPPATASVTSAARPNATTRAARTS